MKKATVVKRMIATNKMVAIMQIDLPKHILKYISTFLYWDVNDKPISIYTSLFNAMCANGFSYAFYRRSIENEEHM